jgi:hypothetical protein
MKTKRKKINRRYRGYYIDYRIAEHEGQHGFARMGVTWTYVYLGNIPINGSTIGDEREESVIFLSWIEKFPRMIKTKKYDLPVNYNELQRNEKRAVRLQYIKEQSNLCAHCEMALHEMPDYEVEMSDIDWSLFPRNFQEHPIHLHHDHKTGMTIGAVHMKCNAWLWQYKGE